MTFVQLKLKLVLLILILPIAAINVASVTLEPVQDDFEEDQCITCHQEIEMLPEGFQKYDVHVQIGLSCAGCHGGDPTSDDEEIAMSEANGFIGVPDHETIPKLCGKCHPIKLRNIRQVFTDRSLSKEITRLLFVPVAIHLIAFYLRTIHVPQFIH
jgi:hypothetical protein